MAELVGDGGLRSGRGQGSRVGERDSSSSPGVDQQVQQPSLSNKRIKRRRNNNWKDAETTALINCMKKGQFRKGKTQDWEAISAEIKKIPGCTRTPKECQRRSDTLKKAHKLVKSRFGHNYKQFFESPEKERSGELSTRLTQDWYEALEQIEQRQQEPDHLSSSNHGSQSTDLIFQQRAQDPETPTRTGVPQVVHPGLLDGEGSGALCSPRKHDPDSIDWCLQEDQDCYHYNRLYFFAELPEN